MVLRRRPLCEMEGCGQPATDVHHRVPLARGGGNAEGTRRTDAVARLVMLLCWFSFSLSLLNPVADIVINSFVYMTRLLIFRRHALAFAMHEKVIPGRIELESHVLVRRK